MADSINLSPLDPDDRTNPFAGSRKLVRPPLTQQATRRPSRREAAVLSTHQDPAPPAATLHTGEAEILYLQKQMQAQTEMVFVLDDGERIQGVIEWYDLHVIKVRHATRTMIYKVSIKYLFKASDTEDKSGRPAFRS